MATTDLTLTDVVTIQLLDSLGHLCDAALDDIRRHVPELEHADPSATAAIRRGLGQSYAELCGLLRSGCPVAATPPVGAVENAVSLRESGLGWPAAEAALRTSLQLFGRAASALDGNVMLPELDALLADYWVEHVTTLADGYQSVRAHEHVALDRGLPEPPGAPAIDAYVAGRSFDSRMAARVSAHSEAVMEEFCEALEVACAEERVAAKLASAGTSVTIVLADQDDVRATLMLDGDTVEIARGTALAAASEIRITTPDLERLFSEEFHLAMAMARGRLAWSGPVRKFLRVAPVISNILLTSASA
jgi:hypothetical protein